MAESWQCEGVPGKPRCVVVLTKPARGAPPKRCPMCAHEIRKVRDRARKAFERAKL